MRHALVLSALALAPSLVAAGAYEDCILNNMRGVQDRLAAAEIRRACKEKATPKKCRDSELMKPKPTEIVFNDGTKATVATSLAPESLPAARDECIADCAKATYWSRTFGECSTD